ncbi:sulfur reduction protein DsrE [Zeaxanthinibacter sp. PT1]|uniref:DsrE family protein n=1 Tax=Zeaxanthinibacter TaxID=561554 RepID=UPI00234BC614|nr:sulfur reduction protein DsrE [Zeaxanthinibacter sp. PT1]MDC6350452.1 sulfur reduction protein DsrE [Zeaxanthinibacter sp. PT1]
MKTLYISLILALTTLFSSPVQAQDITVHNYVVLTKKIPQLKPILLTAKALHEEQGKLFGDFQVIVCGQHIGDLTDKEQMTPYLQEAEAQGVTIVACGFSLKKFKVDAGSLPKGIKVVENGILHNFRLQNKGYKSLSL